MFYNVYQADNGRAYTSSIGFGTRDEAKANRGLWLKHSEVLNWRAIGIAREKRRG